MRPGATGWAGLEPLLRPGSASERARRLLYAGAGAGVVLLLILPLLQDPLQISDFLYFFVTAAAITALLTTALNLCMGFSGLLSIVHTGIFGVGAYCAGILATRLGLNTWLSMLGGVVGATLAGAVIAAISLRARALYFGMITLTFNLIIVGVAINAGKLTGGDTGLFGIPQPQLFGSDLGSRGFYYLSLAVLAGALVLTRNLIRSRTGRSFLAVRESHDTASALGIAPFRTQLLAFTLSSVLAGAAGVLFATLNGFVSPTTADLSGGLILFIGVLLGGTGTVIGPVIGIALIVTVQHFLQNWAQYQQLVFGLVLLCAMLLIPAGVVGTWKRSRLGADPDAPGEPALEIAPVAEPPRQAPSGPALSMTGISKRFGGVTALKSVDLEVDAGTVHGLIGPNGSGKSTLVSIATGALRADAGSIALFGDPAPGRPHRAAAMGVVRVFQSPHIFERLSVLDNAMVGLHLDSRQRLLDAVLRLPAFGRDERRLRGLARQRLAQVGLGELTGRPAGTLSHGQKRLLEVARCLGTRPRLVILDEPATGLTGQEVDSLASLITGLKRLGITILVIEHNVPFVMRVADRVTVLNQGTVLLAGDPSSVQQSPEVRAAYLGASSLAGA